MSLGCCPRGETPGNPKVVLAPFWVGGNTRLSCSFLELLVRLILELLVVLFARLDHRVQLGANLGIVPAASRSGGAAPGVLLIGRSGSGSVEGGEELLKMLMIELIVACFLERCGYGESDVR